MNAEEVTAWQPRLSDLHHAYLALPPAGSVDYWQRLQTHVAEVALPLEVLVRCLRERFDARYFDDSRQIFAILQGRIQRQVTAWSAKVASCGARTNREDVEDELAQDCYLELWRVLTAEDVSYWLTCFGAAITSLQSHTAHAYMERHGIWKRHGVAHPNRVPARVQDSLDALPTDGSSSPLADQIADPDAQRPFDLVEYSDLLALVKKLPAAKRVVVYGRFWQGMKQEEIAQSLGVDIKTVRNREKRALVDLRSQLPPPGGPV